MQPRPLEQPQVDVDRRGGQALERLLRREPVLPQVQQRVVAPPAVAVDARMVALQQTDEALRVGLCLHAWQLLRRLADDCDLKAAAALETPECGL